MGTQRYNARVVDNQDPEQRGRIKVVCPDWTGTDKKPISHWIEPVFEWGFFLVPDVDEAVEIEIVTSSDRDVSFMESAVFNPVINWRGKRWWGGTDESTPAPRPIPDDLKTNYGKRRGFMTPMGHMLMFDDTEGQETVRLSWHKKTAEGEDKWSFIAFDNEGSVSLANMLGTVLSLDAKNKCFTLMEANGNVISADDTSLKMIDKSGGIIEMKDGLIQVLGQSNVVISCKTAKVEGGKVILASEVEPAVLGNKMVMLHDGHIHPTGTGPSGPPTAGTPIPTAQILSQKVFLE